jgi:hypothetical protein
VTTYLDIITAYQKKKKKAMTPIIRSQRLKSLGRGEINLSINVANKTPAAPNAIPRIKDNMW